MTNEPHLRALKRVVVVDDNSLVLGLVTRSLTAIGHHVTACATFDEGQAALEKAPPDVVIVDVRLKGRNGLQLVLWAKDHYPHVKAIAISGFDDADLRREAAKLGADFVVKPFTPAAIRAAVDPSYPDPSPPTGR